MIENIAQVHMTEAELARDLHAVLERVQQGLEVVIEQDHRPVAVLKTVKSPGRPIDERIALAKANGSHATLDEDFAKDLEEIINSHREPLDPPGMGLILDSSVAIAAERRIAPLPAPPKSRCRSSA